MAEEPQFMLVCIVPGGDAHSRFRFYVNDMDGDYPVVTFRPSEAQPLSQEQVVKIRTKLSHPAGNCYIPVEHLTITPYL